MANSRFLKALKKKEGEEDHDQPHAEEGEGHGDAHDESNWLVSYADMMTLLCGFFIMMFSMAKLDEPEFEKVKESVAKHFGGDYKSPSKELAKFVTQIIQEAGLEGEVAVRSDPSGVSLTFNSTLFFDTLSAEVAPKGQEVLNKLIEAIAGRQDAELKKYNIVVEGHTDSRPVMSGSFPTNWELSGARASRVARFFMDKGFESDHLTAIGYADTRPVQASRTPAGALDEAAMTKNRRVVLRVLEPKVKSIPFPEPEQIQVSQNSAVSAQGAPAQPQGRTPAFQPAQPSQSNATPPVSAQNPTRPASSTH